MAAQEMVDIGDEIEESSKEENDDNQDNEHNTNIQQDVSCLTIK